MKPYNTIDNIHALGTLTGGNLHNSIGYYKGKVWEWATIVVVFFYKQYFAATM